MAALHLNIPEEQLLLTKELFKRGMTVEDAAKLSGISVNLARRIRQLIWIAEIVERKRMTRV